MKHICIIEQSTGFILQIYGKEVLTINVLCISKVKHKQILLIERSSYFWIEMKGSATDFKVTLTSSHQSTHTPTSILRLLHNFPHRVLDFAKQRAYVQLEPVVYDGVDGGTEILQDQVTHL